MKVFLTADEQYPVFGIQSADDTFSVAVEIDVPEELIKRWEKVKEEYYKIQNELAELHPDH
jgi:hypothetical protein